MTKTDGSKYEAPRGVRLGDAANSRGENCFTGSYAGDSCRTGNSDTSCGSGSNAHPACYTGNTAHGCLSGDSPTLSCGDGGHPGCLDGNGVYTL